MHYRKCATCWFVNEFSAICTGRDRYPKTRTTNNENRTSFDLLSSILSNNSLLFDGKNWHTNCSSNRISNTVFKFFAHSVWRTRVTDWSRICTAIVRGVSAFQRSRECRRQFLLALTARQSHCLSTATTLIHFDYNHHILCIYFVQPNSIHRRPNCQKKKML